MTTDHGLGYLPDHPLEIASRTNPARWPISLLMAGEPFRAAPDHYLAPGLPETPLDQDGVGACVAFAACGIQNSNESIDEGAFLFKTGVWTNSSASTGTFRAYWDLKHGFGTFPGDGIPTAEGSYPEAVLKLAKAEGLPDGTGKRHKISAYYSMNFADRADFLAMQQAILAFGPLDIGMPWPSNWFASPPGPTYRMPLPGGAAGYGHSIAVVGWDIEPDGDFLVMLNSWGVWGGPKGIFRVRADWLYAFPLGPQVLWKSVDIKEVPMPPPPPPGGTMLTLTDKIARLVDSTVGVQLWRADGTTPLVKLSSGVLGIASPAKYADAAGRTFYSLVISSGGVPQLAWIKAADTTAAVPQVADTTAAFNAGVTAAATAALTAKK